MNIIHLEVWELSQKYSMEGDRESVIYWPWECKKLYPTQPLPTHPPTPFHPPPTQPFHSLG